MPVIRRRTARQPRLITLVDGVFLTNCSLFFYYPVRTAYEMRQLSRHATGYVDRPRRVKYISKEVSR